MNAAGVIRTRYDDDPSSEKTKLVVPSELLRPTLYLVIELSRGRTGGMENVAHDEPPAKRE